MNINYKETAEGDNNDQSRDIIIKEQKIRIEDLKKQVLHLCDKLAKIDEDHLANSRNIEKELESKKVECEKLAHSLSKLKKDYESRLINLENEKKKTEEELKDLMHKQEEDSKKKVDELQFKLTTYEQFKIREDQLNSEIEHWKSKYDQALLQHKEEIAKIQKAAAKEKAELEASKKVREVKLISSSSEKNFHDEVIQILDNKDQNNKNTQQQRTKDDNWRLHNELEMYKRENEVLKKEKDKLLEENKTMKRNFSMQEDGVMEYQTVNFRQATKIKKLKEKVNYLKNYISQEIGRYTKEIESLKFQNQAKLTEVESQLKTYSDQLKLKNKELKNLKSLAQMILDQRSDIEEFFLEAIDYVKEEMKKEEMKKGNKSLNKLPDITMNGKFLNHSTQQIFGENNTTITNNNNNINNKPRTFGEKVNFSSLSWAEKEKILRVLFSKINSGSTPNNYRQISLEKLDTNASPQNVNSAL